MDKQSRVIFTKYLAPTHESGAGIKAYDENKNSVVIKFAEGKDYEMQNITAFEKFCLEYNVDVYSYEFGQCKKGYVFLVKEKE